MYHNIRIVSLFETQNAFEGLSFPAFDWLWKSFNEVLEILVISLIAGAG